MTYQIKVFKLVFILTLLIVLSSGLLVIAGEDTRYKTFTSEEFRFSISYPESWEKTQLPEEENKPQVYQHTSLHLHPTDDLPASVTIYVTEMASPGSLKELKSYLELKSKFAPWSSGLTDVRLGEFVDSRAVLAEYDQISFYEERGADKSGSEKNKWNKRTWKGKMRGMIRNGYLYRISAGGRLEDYEKAKNKYLSEILSSFEFRG